MMRFQWFTTMMWTSFVDPHGSSWEGSLTVVEMKGDGSRFGLSFFVTPSEGG